MPEARTYFVLTTRGQLGPFDRSELREALRAGEVAAADQVRSALGSPRGSVAQVLRADSDRIRTREPGSAAPPATGGGALRGPVPIVIAVLGLVVIAVLALSSEMNATPPPPSPAPVQATPSPPPAPAPEVRSPAPAPAPVVDARPVPAVLRDLLPGRPPSDWMVGGGAQVRPGGPDHAWNIGLPGQGCWVCIDLAQDRRNLDLGSGLALAFAPGSAGTPMTVELIEPSGERFLADFVIPLDPKRPALVPWTAFTRRSWQPNGASNDGLQRRCIQSLSLWQADQLAHVVKLVSIGVY